MSNLKPTLVAKKILERFSGLRANHFAGIELGGDEDGMTIREVTYREDLHYQRNSRRYPRNDSLARIPRRGWRDVRGRVLEGRRNNSIQE